MGSCIESVCGCEPCSRCEEKLEQRMERRGGDGGGGDEKGWIHCLHPLPPSNNTPLVRAATICISMSFINRCSTSAAQTPGTHAGPEPSPLPLAAQHSRHSRRTRLIKRIPQMGLMERESPREPGQLNPARARHGGKKAGKCGGTHRKASVADAPDVPLRILLRLSQHECVSPAEERRRT